MGYSQAQIEELINCDKKVSSSPRRELRLVNGHWRNDMKLVSKGHPGEFTAFFRKNADFQENFSIGLKYDPKNGDGEITLLRCNGPHGAFNRAFDPDHPHCEHHIHTATEAAISAGLKPEKCAAQTTAYASYEEAVQHFLNLIHLETGEADRYFPNTTSQFQFEFEDGED